ncbi:MAG TPA: hypothetical protein PLU39_14285 [Armatimonadota bacterium]|jgi:hypothetical protein|nr:hypothetical protein [Armatimonadota bacterium]HOJ20068.1 hypothetical protein [Armatimonadota bacterium]HOM81229.1 hypothetical protein [Armatimonadota bacterium]HPO73592.1 hypothetical protein [Armatimonadota bacterium]HPT99032.1 hypothetical protein [Armatimonadota bacterium]
MAKVQPTDRPKPQKELSPDEAKQVQGGASNAKEMLKRLNKQAGDILTGDKENK